MQKANYWKVVDARRRIADALVNEILKDGQEISPELRSICLACDEIEIALNELRKTVVSDV